MLEKIKSYLKDEEDNGNGYCVNGHYNVIPACTKIFVGNKLYCPRCNTLIWEVVSKSILFEKKKLSKKKMPGWLKEETRKMQKELENIPPLWEELLFRIFRI